MEYLGALTTILALFIGAYLTRGRELEKSRQDKRSDAYAEFIKVQATISRPDFQMVASKVLSGKEATESELRFFVEVQEQHNVAHSYLVVYGSKDVIRALSGFYNYRDGTATTEGQAAFLNLINCMRKDSAAESYAEFSNDVDNILVGGPARRRAQLLAEQSVHQ